MTCIFFDESRVYCESIKTNQSGYSALSTTRFANFAIWIGNAKVERIDGPLPRYEVIEIDSAGKIAEGVLEEVGPCENTGDFVYRIDLSGVPTGGPYKIVVKDVPIGKGNGIPDIIDEAEWGTLVFEYLQDESGGVRSGIERNGYPEDGPTVDKDTARYGTFRVSAQSTCLAAGLFAHLARALKPYDSDRSEELQKRAERAWAFAGD